MKILDAILLVGGFATLLVALALDSRLYAVLVGLSGLACILAAVLLEARSDRRQTQDERLLSLYPDIDCYTLPDGDCIASPCRLHNPTGDAVIPCIRARCYWGLYLPGHGHRGSEVYVPPGYGRR